MATIQARTLTIFGILVLAGIAVLAQTLVPWVTRDNGLCCAPEPWYSNEPAVRVDFGDDVSLKNEASGETRVERLGELTGDDERRTNGTFTDRYTFEGTAGERVVINVRSSDFDTMLIVHTPGGGHLENDDFEGDTTRSRLTIDLDETGTHEVFVTSFWPGATGAYVLAVDTAAPVERRVEVAAVGRTYGIFVGVADYAGRASNLVFTDDDAVRVRDSIIRGGGMDAGDAVVLSNAQATRASLYAAAQEMASRVGPDDMFVFFFSGHGGQVERSDGGDAADPNGLEETIELYDGPVRDDELAALFDSIPAGKALLVLDSCFSGGFAKDVISAPGRMGLFSSEEDVLSGVAAEFGAGGYLSLFFDEAVGGRQADRNIDGAITVIELSQYVHERYRQEVRAKRDDAKSADDYVAIDDLGYQHIVIDRSGMKPNDVLFDRTSGSSLLAWTSPIFEPFGSDSLETDRSPVRPCRHRSAVGCTRR